MDCDRTDRNRHAGQDMGESADCIWSRFDPDSVDADDGFARSHLEVLEHFSVRLLLSRPRSDPEKTDCEVTPSKPLKNALDTFSTLRIDEWINNFQAQKIGEQSRALQRIRQCVCLKPSRARSRKRCARLAANLHNYARRGAGKWKICLSILKFQSSGCVRLKRVI